MHETFLTFQSREVSSSSSVMQFKTFFLNCLIPENEVTVSLNHQKLLIQHSITFQTTCILSNTTVRTSNFACCNWLDALWVALKWNVSAVKVRRREMWFHVTTTLWNLMHWQSQHHKSLKRGRQQLPAISHGAVSSARPDVILVNHKICSSNLKLANRKYGTKESEQWW